eukprot:361758-Chlamydomonas_euryale.AAC.8
MEGSSSAAASAVYPCVSMATPSPHIVGAQPPIDHTEQSSKVGSLCRVRYAQPGAPLGVSSPFLLCTRN